MNRALLFVVVTALFTASCGEPPAPPPAAVGPSFYVVDASFTDQEGRAARLDVERGRPVLLAMFYASCPTVCPMLIEQIKATIGERDDVRVVLVSLDPERDTPDQLAKVHARHRLDGRWRLMTGDESATREVASLLGVAYRVEGAEIVHSTPIALLDGDGALHGTAEATELAALREKLARVR